MKKFFVSFALFAALIFVISCSGGSKKTDDTTDTGETVTDEDAVDTDSTDSGSGDNTDSTDSGSGDNTDTAHDGGDTTPDGGDSTSDDDADTAHDGSDSAIDDDTDSGNDSDSEPVETEEDKCKKAEGTWKDGKCTKTAVCDSKPANSAWNGASSYTSTYSDGIWSTVKTEYSKTAGECRFTCKDGYFYNGEYCQKQLSIGNLCTGQKKCYSATAEIPCPVETTEANFFGQDPQYSECTPKKIDVKTVSSSNSSSEEVQILIDDVTGLIWLNKSLSAKFDEAQDYCNTQNEKLWGGINDWRVPNPSEFLSIVDFDDYPAVNENLTVAVSTEGRDFWTSKEYNDNKGYMFDTYYGGIGTYGGEKENRRGVLCVSRTQLLQPTSEDFESVDSGVKDKLTNLVWQDESKAFRSWKEALDYCEKSNYKNHSDWRLPNINELASLLNHDKKEAPRSYLPGIQAGYFWSSSTFGDPTSAKLVSFSSGALSSSVQKEDRNDYYAVCVRNDNSPSVECGKVSGTWDEDTGTCTRPCDSKPENTSWNDGGNGGVYTQTYADGAWSTAFSTLHDEDVAGACHYKCDLSSFWKGDHCQKVNLGNLCTGQTKCYDHMKQMDSCPLEGDDFYGQDAQHSEARVDCYGNSKFTQGVALGLHWKVISSNNDHIWNEASLECKALEKWEDNYGNQYDYRLPNRLEMFALLEYGTKYGNIFEADNTSSYWWIGEKDGDSDDYAYALQQYNIIGTSKTSSQKAVICVAGEELSSTKYEEFKKDNVAGGSIVTDTKTGLVWQYNISTTKMDWKAALKYCQELNYAGYEDWRLPNKNELVSLFAPEAERYSNFPGMDREEFWSSTTLCEIRSTGKCLEAYTFDFYTGLDSVPFKNSEAYVKCVRN